MSNKNIENADLSQVGGGYGFRGGHFLGAYNRAAFYTNLANGAAYGAYPAYAAYPADYYAAGPAPVPYAVGYAPGAGWGGGGYYGHAYRGGGGGGFRGFRGGRR